MTDDERAGLAWAWRSRARGEARVGRAFSRLAAAFQPGEVSAFVIDGLTQAAREEDGHAELCFEMAAHYGDARRDVTLPEDPEAPATAAERALVLVSACCISETIATAYLEHCLSEAEDDRARGTLRTLLRDEVGHAQLGWAYVASLPASAPVRATLTHSLPGLIARAEQTWHDRIAELHRTVDPAHGFPSVTACRRIVREAVQGLVLPGFSHVGLSI